MKTKHHSWPARACGLAALWLASILPGSAQSSFDGDWRQWTEFMLQEYKEGNFSSYTWGELRFFDDTSRLGLWYLAQKNYWQLNPRWQAGAGVGFLQVMAPGNGDNNDLWRLELEINPQWKVGEKDKITLRNRLEPRWWENRDYELMYVSRHRLLWSHPARWLPGMTHFESSIEPFFDYDVGEINENRFRPVAFFFKMGEKGSFNTFFQVRSLKIRGDWEHAWIWGVGFRFYLDK